MIEFGYLDGAFTLSAEQWLPRPLPEVFAFFADAGNLDTLTPPWLQFKIMTPLPIAMQAGTLIDYRLRVRGIPLRWRTRIDVWQPPHRFADEQLRGPYRQWIHEHTFTAHTGGTLVRDHVRYAVPGGALVNTLFVRRDIGKIFAYRQEKLTERFG